jgi:hypothetical protein
MQKLDAPILMDEQLRSMALPGGHAAWALQFEYVRWRREQGLEPTAERLNRWLQAMEEMGQTRE